MCIRDSLLGLLDRAVHKHGAAAAQIHGAVGEEAEGRELLDVVAPVSYTHLDVYKRQLQCGPGRRSADAFDFCAGQGREQKN